MIDLGATEFYIKVQALPRREFEIYSTKLFDEWERYVEQALKLPDYALSLQVEEGSIKGGGTIAVALSALYLGIGNYGSFISGAQTLWGQLNAVGDFLAERATAPFPSEGTSSSVTRREGSLGRLNKLFVKVQRGQMTPEQAMVEAEIIFGDEADTAPDFMSELKGTLERMPLFAKQLTLPLDNTVDPKTLIEMNGKKRQPRPPRQSPEPAINQQFRVEVWRSSKKDKRKVRVVQL